jgi:hypothetical protein
MKWVFSVLALLLMTAILVLPACTSTTTETITDTVTSTVTTTMTPTTTPTGLPTTTASELASFGDGVFSGSCVETYCHEPWELDGKEEFVNMHWGFYGDALGFFDFLKRFQPVENPGSLSDLEYLRVAAFMLVELDKIQPEIMFGYDNLADIPLN